MSATSRAARWLCLFLMIALIAACFLFLRHEQAAELRNEVLYMLRAGIVAAALVGWFISQSLISSRESKSGAIGDAVHELTAPLHQYLTAHPRYTNAVLIVSSACIDLFGIFLIGISIFGPTMRPFVALLALFFMRQTCQAVCALPVPPGMLWRHPGVPSLLVTYDVANDFFFSGHTAIAVLGAIEIAHVCPWWLGAAAAVVAFLEASIVLTLRAHYTMDVFAAAVAAVFAANLADWLYAIF